MCLKAGMVTLLLYYILLGWSLLPLPIFLLDIANEAGCEHNQLFLSLKRSHNLTGAPLLISQAIHRFMHHYECPWILNVNLHNISHLSMTDCPEILEYRRGGQFLLSLKYQQESELCPRGRAAVGFLSSFK